MTIKTQQTQAELVRAIADIASNIPLARTVQLYQFALFLKTHPLPTEETFEEVAADEALLGFASRDSPACAPSL